MCGLLSQHLDEGGCTLLQQQSFYRSLTADELADVACAQPRACLCKALLLLQHTAARVVPVLACDVLHRLAAAYNFDRPEAIDQAAFLDALTSLRVCTPLAIACTAVV